MNWYLGRGEEGSMLKVSLTAGALAVAMLVAMTVGKAQAALKPEIAKTEGVTLVGPGGGGGFGGGGGGCQCARCAVATLDQKLGLQPRRSDAPRGR
jgi:hypothetical protein